MQYCFAIPFFDKQNLFCLCQCKAFSQMVDIWKFAACCLRIEKRSLTCVVHWLETAPCFLAVNSVRSWFNYFLRDGNQNTGVWYGGIIICYDDHVKPFEFILTWFLSSINHRYCANFHFRGIKQEQKYQIIFSVFLSKHPRQLYE